MEDGACGKGASPEGAEISDVRGEELGGLPLLGLLRLSGLVQEFSDTSAGPPLHEKKSTQKRRFLLRDDLARDGLGLPNLLLDRPGHPSLG